MIVALALEASRDLLMLALQWPGLILAEKPLGWDLEQTRQLAQAAGDRKLTRVDKETGPLIPSRLPRPPQPSAD